MYRILSLDGGGVYGALTAVLLDRLEKENPGFLAKVDLIAGTSIGGIIALGLAHGKTTGQVVDLFTSHSTEIFHQTWLRKICGWLGVCSRYSNKKLASILHEAYGDATLGELRKSVVIPSFRVRGHDNWHPKIFHNFENVSETPSYFGHLNRSCRDLSLVYVALATSAAPVYFPTSDCYIDGCVAQNNPSMAAICQTQDMEIKLPNRPKLSDISLLSIGHECSGRTISSKDIDWGWARWAKPVIEILLSGTELATEYQCHQLLRNNYCRIGPVMPTELSRSIDDTSAIPGLMDYATGIDLAAAKTWIKDHW